MAQPLEEILRRHFGVTNDLRETGYVLSDGTFIDLSGRHYTGDYVRRGDRFVPRRGPDYQRGHRFVDHRELPEELHDALGKRDGTATMIEFLRRTGALRANPSVGFAVYAMPSVEAVSAFLRGWKAAYGDQPVIVDMDREGDRESLEFEAHSLEEIMEELETHFRERGPSMGATRRPLLEQLQKLRPLMAAAAQKVYDDWTQDPEGVDAELGTGGICDRISEEISDVIGQNISDVGVTEGGGEGDDHSWTIAFRDGKAYGVDIACGVYERGGGYRWRKVPGVTFRPEHVEIFEVPYPEGGFEMGVSEGGTNLQGNRFEADVSPNKERVDIRDRKSGKLFTLLGREDIMELDELVSELKIMMWKKL